jgi:hypothetical protein
MLILRHFVVYIVSTMADAPQYDGTSEFELLTSRDIRYHVM